MLQRRFTELIRRKTIDPQLENAGGIFVINPYLLANPIPIFLAVL